MINWEDMPVKRKFLNSVLIAAVMAGIMSFNLPVMAQNDNTQVVSEAAEENQTGSFESADSLASADSDSIDDNNGNDEDTDVTDADIEPENEDEDEDESESEEAARDALEERKETKATKKPWYHISMADIVAQLTFIAVVTLIGYFIFLRARK